MRVLVWMAMVGFALTAVAGPVEKVESIIAFIRHGARRETKQINLDTEKLVGVYPDPYLGIGDLTLTGMRQSYVLGKAFALRYPHLFGKVADGFQVKAHASTFNRTVTTGHCFFSGVYDLGSGQDIESDKKEHYLPPIPGFDPQFTGKEALPNRASVFPLEVASFAGNVYLTPDNDVTCLPMNKIRKANEQKMNAEYSSHWEPLYRKFREMGFSPSLIEKDKFDFLGALELCDVIVSRAYNDPAFKHYDDNLLEQCVYLSTFYGFKVNSGDYVFGVNQKLNERVAKMLKDLTDDRVKNKQKAFLFFSHDTNLESFWNNFFPEHWQCVLQRYHAKHGDKMQVETGAEVTPYTPHKLLAHGAPVAPEGREKADEFCMEQVKFTANIIMEVFKQDNEHYISFRFNNKEVFLPGKSSPVKLTEVVDILQRNTRPDWDRMCLADKPNPDAPSKMLLAAFLLSAVFALAAVGFLVLTLRKRHLRTSQPVVYEAI